MSTDPVLDHLAAAAQQGRDDQAVKWTRRYDLEHSGRGAVVKRTYTAGGLYPRLTLAVRLNHYGVAVTCDIKDGAQGWWRVAAVPVSLLAELAEVVTEAASLVGAES